MQPQLSGHIEVRPEVLGGVPVFRRTRVPVKALFDYLKAGKSVHAFLADFDGVTPEAVHVVLNAAEENLLGKGMLREESAGQLRAYRR